MKHKHPGTNIIKQLPVSATVTYKMVEAAKEKNSEVYRIKVGSVLYEKYRGENV